MEAQRVVYRRRTLILDTCCFITGYNPLVVVEEQLSVPSVLEELRTGTMGLARFQTAEEVGKLRISSPSKEFMDRLKTCSSSMGETGSLSQADLEVLALALQLKELGGNPVIVSDDYGVQNVAEKIGVQYISLAVLGIKYCFHWVPYCPACHRRFEVTYQSKDCPVCGTALSRRVLSKVKAKKKSFRC